MEAWTNQLYMKTPNQNVVRPKICKGTLRLVFIRIYRLEIFSIQLCELLLLSPSLWFNSPSSPPSLSEHVHCIPRNLSHHMIRKPSIGDTVFRAVQSREMRGGTQTLPTMPCWLGGGRVKRTENKIHWGKTKIPGYNAERIEQESYDRLLFGSHETSPII
jgi:hypothetical protein